MNRRTELFTELQRVAERVHAAMESADGRPEPFRDEVALLLIEHESDLDVNSVFVAVLAAASRSRATALDELYQNGSD